MAAIKLFFLLFVITSAEDSMKKDEITSILNQFMTVVNGKFNALEAEIMNVKKKNQVGKFTKCLLSVKTARYLTAVTFDVFF